MRKHFVSASKNYEKLGDSLSDSEIEVRRISRERIDKLLSEDFQLKCSIGDKLKKSSPSSSPPSKKNHSKVYSHMKIADEARIDLRRNDSPRSASTSNHSIRKIYPIDEVSENVSHASSKMRFHEYQKQQQVQRIIEENNFRSKARPKEVKGQKSASPVKFEHEVEIFKPFHHLSEESIIESAFAEYLERSPERKKFELPEEHARYEETNSPFGSIASFKRAQFHRLSNDVLEYQKRKQKSKHFANSSHELETIETFSSYSSRSSSCFGCLFKPISNLCIKKSNKH